MPKTTKGGKPKQHELPSTIQRSGAKAQRTFAKAHDGAAESYGEGERAHRTAYAALKHTHEKVGDHWEPKDQKGPSDPRASHPRAREGKGQTYGGIDASKPKRELYEDARRAGIEGRSRMSKRELAKALERESRRQTARARG
ncbi:MAG TPA: ChaB family protein [Baekduia sp.]|nr:ChaB family protein [Baekduia sp.]